VAGPPTGLAADCLRIAERLRQGAPVLDALEGGSECNGQTFQLLVKALRQAISNNEPEAALDRLHTYVVKYMRSLCGRHGIEADRDRPLHSLVGGYVKHLKAAGLIESRMTERILKSNIAILEQFNDVRNNQSLAHDNAVLNYHESLLIFDHVVCTVRFIESVERAAAEARSTAIRQEGLEDIPL
jgi:hypothetical protein